MNVNREEYYGYVASVDYFDEFSDVTFDVTPKYQIDELNIDNKDGILAYLSDYKAAFVTIKLSRDNLQQIRFDRGKKITKGRWFTFVLNGGNNESIEAVFNSNNIDEPPTPSRISELTCLFNFQEEAVKLKRIFSLEWIPENATEHQIRDTLNKPFDILSADHGLYVACYNVGQGNCCSLCVPPGEPLLYFDFGGGYRRDADTYPEGKSFCFSFNPPIVLSHWDGDHWISGRLHEEAQDCQWIAPRQRKLTQDAVSFAMQLHNKGKLLLWSDGLPAITFPWGTILKLPDNSTTNQSGLVLVTRLDKDDCMDIVLLPGDAQYGRISKQLKLHEINGLIASHHGAEDVTGRIPTSRGTHKIAYAYGEPNHHGHPSQAAIDKYEIAGWLNRYNTPDGDIIVSVCPEADDQLSLCDGGECDSKENVLERFEKLNSEGVMISSDTLDKIRAQHRENT